jgi:DNA-binding transcriptional ArsR family regulator
MSTFSFDLKAASRLLDILGSPVRLEILRILAMGEISVTALAARIGMSQSAISQHLKKMRDRGVVMTRRSAQTIYYSLPAGSSASVVLAALDGPPVPEPVIL